MSVVRNKLLPCFRDNRDNINGKKRGKIWHKQTKLEIFLKNYKPHPRLGMIYMVGSISSMQHQNIKTLLGLRHYTGFSQEDGAVITLNKRKLFNILFKIF